MKPLHQATFQTKKLINIGLAVWEPMAQTDTDTRVKIAWLSSAPLLRRGLK